MIKLLLVEDNFDIASFLTNGLKKISDEYKIAIANNGKEAIKQWKLFKPDIITSDINMPVMNGFQMAEIIRNIDLHIPIIFFTGFNTRENVLGSYEVGANYYLKKPFEIDEFDAHIKGILNRNSNKSNDDCYKIGSFTYLKKHFILRHEPTNEEIRLTKMESDVLLILVTKLNEPISKNVFYHILWNPSNDEKSLQNCLYKQIKNMRKYIKRDSNVQIVSLSRIGYKLEVKST